MAGAVALLQDTVFILVFFMLIFGIGGLNLFMGMVLQRCVEIDTGMTLLDDDDIRDLLHVKCGSCLKYFSIS